MNTFTIGVVRGWWGIAASPSESDTVESKVSQGERIFLGSRDGLNQTK